MISPEELSEYSSELQQLADEKKLNDDTVKSCEKRDKVIKARIGAIADVLIGTDTRAVLPVPELQLEWDRRITGRNSGGVDLARLEASLGVKQFRRLLCDRQVSYGVSEAKFLAAREVGELTEELVTSCLIPPKLGSAVYLSPMRAEAETEYNSEEGGS